MVRGPQRGGPGTPGGCGGSWRDLGGVRGPATGGGGVEDQWDGEYPGIDGASSLRSRSGGPRPIAPEEGPGRRNNPVRGQVHQHQKSGKQGSPLWVAAAPDRATPDNVTAASIGQGGIGHRELRGRAPPSQEKKGRASRWPRRRAAPASRRPHLRLGRTIPLTPRERIVSGAAADRGNRRPVEKNGPEFHPKSRAWVAT